MEAILADHTPQVTKFNDDQSERRANKRRAVYVSISSMKRRIAHLAGLDNHAFDTVEAIIACQREVIKTEAGRWENPPACREFSASLETIGGKMALGSNNPDSLRKSAGRRCDTLFNEIQPSLGREFITRAGGEYDPASGTRKCYRYTDHFTPAADRAYQEFRAAIRAEKMTPEKKRELFDECARAALDKLPEAGDLPERETGEARRLNAAEYRDQRIRQVIASIENTLDKIDQEYADPLIADMFAEECVRQITSIWRSRSKLNRTLSGEDNHSSRIALDEVSRTGQGGESGYNLGTFAEAEETGEPWDIMSLGRDDNTSDFNDLTPPNSANLHNNEVLTWARRYIANGWRVVLNYGIRPDGACMCQAGRECGSVGKHPIGGTPAATSDIREIERSLRRYPGANLGIVTGEESDLIILDFDGPEGRELFREWAAAGYLTDGALVQETGGGGLHYALKWFPGLSAKVKGLPGFDIRSHNNSQIVAAPSIHASGNRYEWANWGADSAEASEEFKALLLSIAPADKPERSRPEAVQVEETGDPIEGQVSFYKSYPTGERNQRMFELACALRGQRGAGYDAILGELRHRNETIQIDKLPDMELQKIARSACRYPAAAVV